ncbi:cholinesterase 1-like isoform X2 [Mya arenaria]|uniref:cholinesterase 1-like isoform X2 n=1 Tax=Mya arenaria TaxID=6604 RepID=UPI0022E24814|nr:cholinesterase 1-like isoform X2 [Mya arenaria]
MSSTGLEYDSKFFGISRTMRSFKGIPYAEPPVGELRFRKPVPKSLFEGTFEATRHGPACLQVDLGIQPPTGIRYSEDCLFLNIYTPRVGVKERLPIMIWFHGGGFVAGSSNMYIGDHLAAFGQVVVVTVNFRLTVFGFLSTVDDSSRGNYGLWDQHLAIKWIHDNAAAFNGDASRVTLFGESAGGAAVMFQGMFPGNERLVHRAILQSGTALAFWAVEREPLHKAKRLGSYLNCTSEITSKLAECLRSVDAEQLISIVRDVDGEFFTFPNPFIPSVDNKFIDWEIDAIESSVQTGACKYTKNSSRFSSLDVMVGMTADEGSLALGQLFGVADVENFTPNRKEFKNVHIPIALFQRFYKKYRNSDLINELVAHEYTDAFVTERSSGYRNTFLALHSDSIMLDPLYRTLELHACPQGRKSYMYVLADELEDRPFFQVDWFRGAGHGDELPLLFGFSNPTGVGERHQYHADKDWKVRLSQYIMTMWTNFAQTGDPNSPERIPVSWKPYEDSTKFYLEISRSMTKKNLKHSYRTKQAYFWRHVVPQMLNMYNSCATAFDSLNSHFSTSKSDFCTSKECHP